MQIKSLIGGKNSILSFNLQVFLLQIYNFNIVRAYIKIKNGLLLLLLLLTLPIGAQQITGYVKDAETGDSIGFASVVYEGHHVWPC